MSRIRSIKPDFFLDEELAELSPLHRLLFIGLWTQADRRGRLEDRPKRIKAAALPYDDCDVETLLQGLSDAEFIIRYEVDGDRYIAIPTFEKHQRVSGKEAQNDSEIPPPKSKTKGKHRGSTGEATGKHPGAQEGKGKEGNGVQEGKGEPADADASSPPGPADLQAAWNELAQRPLPRWQEMPKKRSDAAENRLAERPLSAWRDVIARISASKFCRGENDRGWRADPDWLLKPDTAAKVLEGKYDDRISALGRDLANHAANEYELAPTGKAVT